MTIPKKEIGNIFTLLILILKKGITFSLLIPFSIRIKDLMLPLA